MLSGTNYYLNLVYYRKHSLNTWSRYSLILFSCFLYCIFFFVVVFCKYKSIYLTVCLHYCIATELTWDLTFNFTSKQYNCGWWSPEFWSGALWSLCRWYVCACVLSPVWLFGTPMDCSLPGSSVHGISQARILGWSCHFLHPGIEPCVRGLLHCRQNLTTEPSGKPKRWYSSAYSRVPISASLRCVISICRLVCKRQNLRRSEVFCFCATVWVCMCVCVCVSERDTEKKLFLVRSGVFLQRLKVSDVKGWLVLKC